MNGEQMLMKLGRTSKVFFRKHSPTILTCVGAAGVVATTVTAVKATPKALELIKEAKEEKGDDLTKLETVRVAGPVYIPTILLGASTIVCIFGANVLNKRHQASLASAYALLDNSYKEYRSKVKELYGDEADFRIKEEMAKDDFEENSMYPSEDKQLFYDMYSERYFEATMETVIKAEYEINKKISMWGGADLNEFYDLLGIDPVDYGDYVGWSSGGMMEMTWSEWLDFYHEKTEMDDGLECTIISMSVEPMYDYEYY
jgi:hypothetical protein